MPPALLMLGRVKLHLEKVFFFTFFKINHLSISGPPILLPTAAGLASGERLLANRRLGAQVKAALKVMLLVFLLMLLQLLRHRY